MQTQIDIQNWRRNFGKSKMDLGFPRQDNWWTGKEPVFGKCPGVAANGKISALTIPNLKTCTRQEVLDYFDNGWTLTEVLFSGLLGEEAFYRPPYHGLRHPLAFYYGHPATLYINKLLVSGLVSTPINSYFERLFETGVDEMSWDDMSKNDIEWPSIDELWQYRKEVYRVVTNLIATSEGLNPDHDLINQDNPLWALFMGFEHERIHFETSSVLVRELPIHLIKKPLQWPDLHESFNPDSQKDFTANEFISVPFALVEIGKPKDWPTYGWDNEYGKRTINVHEFMTTRHLISNAEFWQFVAEGGYTDEKYWSEVGWQWRVFRNAKWPTFWYQNGPAGSHEYQLRTMFEVLPMQWSWPAIVNYHEARAYASWLTEKKQSKVPYRLITEAEHHRLRELVGVKNKDEHLAVSPLYNINLHYGSESAVDALDTFGLPCADVFGNVWQWCEDEFNPLPGFKVHRYYDDFSTPCFDGEHKMIMGGSFVSVGDEDTPWARFHFRPHFFQHAGFRLAYCPDGDDGSAQHVENPNVVSNQYETQLLVDQYMLLHFGDKDNQMPYAKGPAEALEFPSRCADLLIEWTKKLSLPQEKVLDIGCAVGGSSFRLVQAFKHVEAIDLSEAFITAAKTLQSQGHYQYRVLEEGELYKDATFEIESDAGKNINFRRADACSLPAEYVDYDAVLLANVLCRLPSPMACLSRMSGDLAVVRKGGLLMLTTPFTWMEQFTPKDVWLGGYYDENGNARTSEEGLKEVLSPNFELVHRQDMPLVIREHKRKYQYIVALATIWRRVK
ncbi:MAG: 5-histidylcysteine sulfoxide synthase [Candidatus Obscuribacterales bacterium]|nr:5-histidylcysteine sulfoxide synthase [Candidatus Obscuribacterales bacterium]